jgi:hypothetical protein
VIGWDFGLTTRKLTLAPAVSTCVIDALKGRSQGPTSMNNDEVMHWTRARMRHTSGMYGGSLKFYWGMVERTKGMGQRDFLRLVGQSGHVEA